MSISPERFHIQCSPGDIGGYCILPGDPARCEIISEYFDDPVFISQNREFRIYSGRLNGEKVSVCSTGIGGPSAAIAMEELATCGAHTFIRVGTCGGIAERVKSGDSIIVSAAVRQDGTSHEYAPPEFPAVSDFELVSAMAQVAKAKKYPYHVGVIQSKDSFYGQHSPERMPVENALRAKWEAWKRLGVLGSEMECATLFTVAAALGVRCGGVMHVIWNQERKALGYDEPVVHETNKAIEIAVEAIKLLINETDI